jgi:hypothetical protein
MMQLLATHTSEPNDTTISSGENDKHFDAGRHSAAFDGESFWGHGIFAGLQRSSRHWWFDLGYWERSPTFRVDNGFESANNQRLIDFDMGIEINTNTPLIAKINPFLTIGRKWNFAKERKDEWIVGELGFQLKGQTYLEIGYLGSRELYRGVDFPGIRNYHLCFDSRFSRPLWIGMEVSTGHRIARRVDPLPIMGNEKRISVWATIKPINRLTIKPAYDYVKSDSLATGGIIFKEYTFRNRLDLQISNQLSFRFIVQYDDFYGIWQFDPLITYRLNPFTLCYFGSTHELNNFVDYKNIGLKETSRQLFFKIQYLFQV